MKITLYLRRLYRERGSTTADYVRDKPGEVDCAKVAGCGYALKMPHTK